MKGFFVNCVAFAFMLFASSDLFGQSQERSFGQVADSLVHKTRFDQFPESDAIILSNIGKVIIASNGKDPFTANYSIQRIIKILKKDGLQDADLELPYFVFEGSSEEIFNIRGYVYNVEGETVTKQDISSDHIYDEEVTGSIHIKKISPPNLREGSVVEISYEMTSPLLGNIRDWRFQEEIPTLFSSYTFEYPEYFAFRHSAQGFLELDKAEKHIGSGKTAFRNLGKYNTVIHTFEVRDAPGLDPEPYIDNPQSYGSRVEYQLQSIQYPNSVLWEYSSTWNQVGEKFLKGDDFGEILNRGGYAASIVPTIVGDAKSGEEIAKKIYYYITDNISWNGGVGIYPSQELEKVFKSKSGNAADLNLLLAQFLDKAGLSAFPVLTSTRASGILNPATPVMYKINYVLVALLLQEKTIILDATNPDLPFGFLPVKALNFHGYALIPGQFQWLEIGNSIPNSEVTMINMGISEEQLVANIQQNFYGYGAAIVKSAIRSEGKEKLEERFREELQDWELGEIIWENLDAREKPLVQKYDLTGNSGLVVSGEFIYLNPGENLVFSDNPFKQEQRIYPIDFIYPQKRQTVINIDVPEGYVIDEIPKGMIHHLNDKGLLYSYRISTPAPDKIAIVVNFQVNQTLFESGQYPDIKEFFDAISQKQKENIVLKKGQ